MVHLHLCKPPFFLMAMSFFIYTFTSKLAIFLQLIGTIKRTIFRKVRTETILQIYNTYFYLHFYMGQKLDSNSLTKTKNWTGRNEVTETSGRLQPLWPQDKRLRTPRSTYYRHTRQDRWIQTKLVSALAKNATKPNPFEFILLQTTRKENNWKTEETLERAAVTLETERIKGSNPWWWWWWWWWRPLFQERN